MSVTALALLLSTALYTGFQWTIRVLVYPQFRSVGAGDFEAYEARHRWLVSIAVGPLFAALVLSTGAVVVHPPNGVALWARFGTVVLLAVVLGTTALFAVPLHARLSSGFDARVHRRLLHVDSVRLLAAAADTALAVYLAVR